jgi:hypothetical protein
MAIIAAVCALALAPLAEAPAAGNLTRRAERLEELELNAGSGFSIKAYDLETGVYYRWRIVSDGREEYRLVAPGLFRNSWIDRVSIEGMEVVPTGLQSVAFDDEGEIDIWFVPIRPGDYRFHVEGLETQGFSGVMHVR